MTVKIDLPKAKLVAHDIRRADRSKQLEPHDLAIAAQIPGTDAVAEEAARQAIRDANAIVQTDIDGAVDEVALKQVLVDAGML